MKRLLFLSVLLITGFSFGQELIIEWQKSLGGSGYEGANSIEQTSDGGYIVAGITESNDGDVTGNNGGYDYWIVKLDNTGNITWQKTLGGTLVDNAKSIQQTTDGGYIVAGTSQSNDGDVTGNNGSYDYWIVKLYECTNTTGSEIVTACDSYNWITNGQTYTQSGQYISVIPNAAGCDSIITLDLTVGTPIEPICIVSVDSSSTKNLIVWEKPIVEYIDSFFVYRDIVGNYTKIGSVPYDSLSQFVDATNGVNPNITSYRYKISVIDTCGNESVLSDFHETMHLSTNLSPDGDVNLIWDGYEGFTVSYYRILRDSTGNNQWEVLDSVSNNVFIWTDINPPSVGADYVIEIVTPFTCTATKAQDYNSSRSNKARGEMNPNTGLVENNASFLTVFPNPTSNSFTITSEKVINSNFRIMDGQGRAVFTGTMNGQEHTMDISKLSKGVYSVVFEQQDLPVLSVVKE